jgi:hypothetical protein
MQRLPRIVYIILTIIGNNQAHKEMRRSMKHILLQVNNGAPALRSACFDTLPDAYRATLMSLLQETE